MGLERANVNAGDHAPEGRQRFTDGSEGWVVKEGIGEGYRVSRTGLLHLEEIVDAPEQALLNGRGNSVERLIGDGVIWDGCIGLDRDIIPVLEGSDGAGGNLQTKGIEEEVKIAETDLHDRFADRTRIYRAWQVCRMGKGW